MNTGSSIRRIVRLIAIGAWMTVASLLLVYLFGLVIHQIESPGPVEEWMEIGFKRNHFAGLYSTGVLISDERYESELQELLKREDLVFPDDDFPRDWEELSYYQRSRQNSLPWPTAFWIAFACSVMTAIAATSWLRGAAFAAKEASKSEDSDLSLFQPTPQMMRSRAADGTKSTWPESLTD